MKKVIVSGIGFGVTSAVITTLGLMVGLATGTSSKVAVIGGVLTIAIADAMSDALGMHVSEESQNSHTKNDILVVTVATFLAKLAVGLSFVFPVLVFKLEDAVFINIIWGLLVLGVFSFWIAKRRKDNPLKTIAEHVLTALFVIFVSNLIGEIIKNYFS